MFITKRIRTDHHTHGQKGTVTVEYAVVTTLLILTLALYVVPRLADPGEVGTSEYNSALPKTYKLVADKVGHFGTLPE